MKGDGVGFSGVSPYRVRGRATQEHLEKVNCGIRHLECILRFQCLLVGILTYPLNPSPESVPETSLISLQKSCQTASHSR